MSTDADPATPSSTSPGVDDLDGPAREAAQAVADGTWPPASASETLDAELLRQFQIIANVAHVHQVGGRGRDADGHDSSGSLGEVLARSTTPLAARPDLLTARRWGPLFMLERVGGGSFGEVYRAWDPALDREVALKLLRVPVAQQSQATAYVREGQLLASVRHPNVINVHGAAHIDGTVGIWMEFVRGRTLERIVLEDGPMSAQEATVIAESLCSALSAVHQQGLLHRDIKAANVMRASGGRIVLLDFGTGTEAVAHEGDPRRLAGTPLYMAPEVLEGTPATARSDIYSFGVLLFFLVTGSYPVYGRSLADVRALHAAGRRVLLSDARPDLPSAFARTVERAVGPVPSQRPRSIGELAQLLQEDVRPGSELKRLIGRLVLAGLAATAGVWALGLTTSLAFNATLDRTGPFAREPWSAYWVWGARALVAPAVAAALAAVVGGVVWTMVRAATGLTSGWFGLQAYWRRVRARNDSRIRSAGDALICLQLLLLFGLGWRFQQVFVATTRHVSTADPSAFAVFQPDNIDERNLFSLCFAWGCLLSIASWVWIERAGRSGTRRVQPATRTAAVAFSALLVFMLVLPYRIGWHNDAQRVRFDATRCYVIGSAGRELLLYCPSLQSPKVRPVDSADERLSRENVVESIFTP